MSSAGTTKGLHDLVDLAHIETQPDGAIARQFARQSANRRTLGGLPPSRYQYASPKFYRGPLHPLQPPKPSDIASREFRPGPFSHARLADTYSARVEEDLMTLLYTHVPPDGPPEQQADRQRYWDAEYNPHFKNRPARPVRGPMPHLPLVRHRISHMNLPTLRKITAHAFVLDAGRDRTFLTVAGAALQAITGVRTQMHRLRRRHVIKRSEGIKIGAPVSVSATMTGEAMWDFLAKCTDIVLPRIKDWTGVRPRGDRAGNVAFRLSSAAVGFFPDIEFNYESYPAKQIPSVSILIETTARADKDGLLLLSALGLPISERIPA